MKVRAVSVAVFQIRINKGWSGKGIIKLEGYSYKQLLKDSDLTLNHISSSNYFPIPKDY